MDLIDMPVIKWYVIVLWYNLHFTVIDNCLIPIQDICITFSKYCLKKKVIWVLGDFFFFFVRHLNWIWRNTASGQLPADWYFSTVICFCFLSVPFLKYVILLLFLIHSWSAQETSNMWIHKVQVVQVHNGINQHAEMWNKRLTFFTCFIILIE